MNDAAAMPSPLLIDSHVLLWALTDSPRLSEATRSLMVQASRVAVSTASIWEIEIKRCSGKLDIAEGFLGYITSSEFHILDITAEHGLAAAALPLHHRDPFDRMLIAQARCEGLTLVTHDKDIQKYDVPLLVV